MPACDICSDNFATVDELSLHMSQAHPRHRICELCQKPVIDLNRHRGEKHLQERKFACPHCDKTYKRKEKLETHSKRNHSGKGHIQEASDQPKCKVPRRASPTPERSGIENYPADIQRILGKNWKHVRGYTKENRPVKDSYNIQLEDGYDIHKIEEQLRRIHHKQRFAYKIEVAAGAVLKRRAPPQENPGEGVGNEEEPNDTTTGCDTEGPSTSAPTIDTDETDTLRYLYPSANTGIVKVGTPITNIVEFNDLISRLREADVEQEILKNRPDTSYVVHTITNVLVNVYKIREHLVGAPTTIEELIIAEHLGNKRSVKNFTTVHKRPVTDKLCFFRALAYHINKKDDVHTEAYRLFRQWTKFARIDPDHRKFEGVRLSDLPQLENCFKINIRVYSLTATITEAGDGDENYEDGGIVVSAVSVMKSRGIYSDTINLNLNYEHFSYIVNRAAYANSWKCDRCGRLFKRTDTLAKHQKDVECGTVKYEYKGGGFGLKPTVFEELERNGINVSDERRFYELRAIFDWECRFEEMEPTGNKLEFMKKLIPASVSIIANVAGYDTPLCLMDDDPKALVAAFFNYLHETAEAAHEIMADEYRDVLDALNAKQAYFDDLVSKRNEAVEADDEATKMEAEEKLGDYKQFSKMKHRFEQWLRRLPVLGFNSGKFDLNLIKEHLLPHLLDTLEAASIRPIKRGENFMAITLPNMQILDICNYLGAGTSYDKWIKAFQIPQTKGFWPYEWFKEFRQLEQAHLPPIEEFWSTLRQRGISQAEYDQMQETWRQMNFSSMRDLLTWYNNLDVVPFLEAVGKMFNQFKSMGLDMFKQGAISLPGLAMLHLFKDMAPEDFIQLFDGQTKHWHDKVRQNIVGGPSIIFSRIQVAGETRIRGGKMTEAVLGYDANALYLYCTGLPMPVGLATYYKPKGDQDIREVPVNETEDMSHAEVMDRIRHNLSHRFKRSKKGESELCYVLWRFKKLQDQHPDKKLTLLHQNNGGQMKFNKGKKAIFVDGYVPEIKTIIQHHGCYWHGHHCMANKMPYDLRLEKEVETESIRQFLQCTGNTIIEGYGCEVKAETERDPELKAFIKSRQQWGKSNMTGQQIIDGVASGRLFGLVECDLQVPYWRRDLREHMAEMTPIFKNTEIKLQDLGPYMRQFAVDHKMMKTPRRSLIGSYFGTKTVFTTPLLRWYLEHGLVITHVYSAAQYEPKPIFKHLADEVSSHRAEADRDKNKKVIAELYKLLGNSYYGKCITDKTKQNNVSYVHTDEAIDSVNNPLFKKLDEITRDIYEVSMEKKSIKFDLPILVAFFVYQHAKLRMLEFHYDFLDKVLDRRDYQMVEMDTDSLYFACTATSLEAAVRPERKHIFERLKHEYLALNTDPHSPGYDQRVPGLFKVEWVGKGMIALCSKSYIGFSDSDDYKISAKGLNKNVNAEKLNPTNFRNVLENKTMMDGTNYGFRLKNSHLEKYRQTKRGLTFFYAKRIALEDGSTVPLSI